MVADKEYDVECEIDCQAFTKNEDAMTKQRVYVDQDPTKIPDDEGNIKPSSTKRKKHKKKKKKPVTMNSTCELGDDEDVKESVVVVLSNDNDRSCMTTTSTTTSITTTSTRTPSKKPIIVQRGLLSTGFTKDYIKYGQTDPPTIPVAKLFQQQQNIPCGEYQYDTDRMHYYYQTKFGNGGRSYRITPKEAAMLSQCVTTTTTTTSVASTTELDIMNDVYQKLRLGGEIHRQVRNFTQSIIQPGIELSDMCTQLENMNRLLTQEAGIQRGIAFPTGCSINHVAAHYTPNTGDRTVLQYNDVMKVDFGVQIDGYIIDSAWTVAFNERYDPLLQAVKEATEMGIVTAGIDQRLCDIGANIQEVMESYEIELQNHIYPIRAIRNLGGHSINRYQIHGAKSVPIVKNGCDESIVMDEYELYAIETFGSTGRGYVIEDMEYSHYMKRFDAPYIPLRMTSSKKLLHHIDKTFGTLAFCRRWLDRKDGGSAYVHGTAGGGQQVKYMGALKNLCDVGIIQPIPPLCDVHGCYTAQYEHTFMIQPNGKKEIFSRGTDY